MVVYLLTDAGGRRSYMVQGVRSRNGRGSKLALFQPMFPVEFEGLESPRQQMHRFKEVRGGFVLAEPAVRRAQIDHGALHGRGFVPPRQGVRRTQPACRPFDFVWNSVGALDSMDEGVANFHLWFLANLSRFPGVLSRATTTPPATGSISVRGFIRKPGPRTLAI